MWTLPILQLLKIGSSGEFLTAMFCTFVICWDEYVDVSFSIDSRTLTSMSSGRSVLSFNPSRSGSSLGRIEKLAWSSDVFHTGQGFGCYGAL